MDKDAKQGGSRDTEPEKTIEPERRTGTEQSSPTVNTDFMKEQIKQRPINRKRLARRTLLTAALAVVFGAVACAAFLLLEPVINKMLNPPENPQAVTFPENTTEEEMSPTDMIESDKEIQDAAVKEQVSKMDSEIRSEISKEVASQIKEKASEENASGMEEMYDALLGVAKNVQKSCVNVSAISSDEDWAGDTFQSAGQMSGLIAAENNEKLYILSDSDGLSDADEVMVTFSDGTQAEASLLEEDSVTGLAVLTVKESALSASTKNEISAAALGSSARDSLLGKPVIALGSPSGTAGSVSYGIVTNAALPLEITDSEYYQVTTDIYGSTKATGVLADTDGRVIGWIDMSYNKADSQNLISALGISEIKSLIADLSNQADRAFLGICGTEVPNDIQKNEKIPAGVYITKIDMDSPAMKAGIQNGDVITAVGGKTVITYSDYTDAQADLQPGTTVTVRIERSGSSGYEKADLKVTPAARFTAAAGN